MRRLLLLALLPQAAHATFFTSDADPSLVSALTGGLCDGTFQNAQHDYVLTFQGAGESLVLTLSMPPSAEGMYTSQVSPPPDRRCRVNLLGGVTTVRFDRPVRAAGLRVTACSGSFVRIFATAGAQSESTTVPCPLASPAPFAGVRDLGALDELRIESDGFTVGVEELRAAVGVSPPAQADLALTAPPARGGRGASVRAPMQLENLGPGAAAGVAIVSIPSVRYIVAATPTAARDGAAYVFGVGALPFGGTAEVALQVSLPTEMACDDPFLNVAHPRATTADPVASNNVVVQRVSLDRATIPPQEDCDSLADDDCDGRSNCVDPECGAHPRCLPPILYVHGGQPEPYGGGWWPPPVLPIPGSPGADPIGDLMKWSDWRNPPMAPPNCYIQRHGMPEIAPQYCCDPAAAHPGVDRTRCVPLDPNALEALSPAVNALGFGLAAPGQVLRYRAHYENIGGADAHDVEVIVALDDDLDDSTLQIDGGGRYDASSRTIRWVDPVVFPSDPRHFDFSAAVAAGARPDTRVRLVATVVFPDAAPPTRIDTNFVEHAIPEPAGPREPVLAVFACERVAGTDTWRVKLENRSWYFAYNISARLVDPPAELTVTDGEVRFAEPNDPEPDRLGAAPPLTAVLSVDTIEVGGLPAGERCEVLRWQLSYETSAGEARVVMAQGALDADGDGVADYRAAAQPSPDGGVPMVPAVPGGTADPEASGCGCRAGAAGDLSVLLLLLAAVPGLRRRR